MKTGFHPHIWSPVENEREMTVILENTDPRYVGLVPDTAHMVLGKMDPGEGGCARTMRASSPST